MRFEPFPKGRSQEIEQRRREQPQRLAAIALFGVEGQAHREESQKRTEPQSLRGPTLFLILHEVFRELASF
jgi:hypothetical protein